VVSTQRYQKSTIKDVAARAGVSTTTVSHFVSGRTASCSAETAVRINRAVADLHYTPGYLGRGLRQTGAKILGVCIKNPSDTEEHPFTDRVWRGVNAAASDQGYSVLHYPDCVRDDPDYRLFLDGHISGLILGTNNADARPAMLAAAGIPTVLLTRSLGLPAGCGAVYADEAGVVGLALSHLWEMGHRHIAYIAGPVAGGPGCAPSSTSDAALWRCRAFTAWLAARGVPDGRVWYGRHSDDAADALAAWRQEPEPPTAVLCFNDQLALDTLASAEALGWRVPDELSVVGVDNTAERGISHPPLTTVEVAGAQIGREAVRCLVAMMDGAAPETCRVCIPVTELVVRSTTAAPRQRFSLPSIGL